MGKLKITDSFKKDLDNVLQKNGYPPASKFTIKHVNSSNDGSVPTPPVKKLDDGRR